jgi:hypothetical protein
MANRDLILDGLAWAGIPEPVRVARIAAALVREKSESCDSLTKTRIREAVRDTSPPYGRGKAIYEAVTKEIDRQSPIFEERKQGHEEWKAWNAHMAEHSTRMNHAYAAVFDRTPYSPHRRYTGDYSDWDARVAFDKVESDRDKGDECTSLTHFKGHVVCLVVTQDTGRFPHIATRMGSGPIVRTYLRNPYQPPADLVEAAVSLGGPKVRAAFSLGKKVITDWVDRLTLIHHEGQDHHERGVEIVPWRGVVYGDDDGYHPRTTNVLILGEKTWVDDSAGED